MTTLDLLNFDFTFDSKLYYNPSDIINGAWHHKEKRMCMLCPTDTNGILTGPILIIIIHDNDILKCVGTFFEVEDGFLITFTCAYKEAKSRIYNIDTATGKIFFDEPNKLYLESVYSCDRPKKYFSANDSLLYELCNHENITYTKI